MLGEVMLFTFDRLDVAEEVNAVCNAFIICTVAITHMGMVPQTRMSTASTSPETC
jgi:hypothetical protein